MKNNFPKLLLLIVFSTGNLLAQFPGPYCGPLNFTEDVEPITLVQVADINHVSDATVNGSDAHEDFTAVVGNVEKGELYPIALEGNTAGAYTNRFVVFIDWNQNGVLDDAGEVYEMDNTIYFSTGTDNQQALGTIEVPVDAMEGETRMRVKKIFSTTDFLDPCMGMEYGQAEDYTINVMPEVCEPPTNLVLDDVTTTTATISWTASISENDGYAWAVFLEGQDPFMDDPVVSDFILEQGITTVEITGLDPETAYDFYMITICDIVADTISEIVGPFPFTTEVLALDDNVFSNVDFYPNPTSGVINLNANHTIDQVDIYNVSGQKIKTQKIGATASQLDISELATGIYLMEITAGEQTQTFKITKK